MGKFPYKTEPLPHQREDLLKMAHLPYYAWFHPQGLGKAKIGIDNIAWLYLKGKIDAVIWMAPTGAATNFVTDELAQHMSTEVPYDLVHWQSGKMEFSVNKVRKPKPALGALLKSERLAILAINPEACLTKLGHKFMVAMLAKRRCFFNVDESSYIGIPGSKVTMRLQSYSRKAPYRRLMNGTPGAEGPLKYYSQLRFLHPSILGFSNYNDYKEFAAEWEERQIGPKDEQGNRRGIKLIATNFDGSKRWRNLEEIARRVATYSSRADKSCLKLPPKTYAKRPYALNPVHRAAYNEVLYRYYKMFDDGAFVDGSNPAVRTMRLQQIACGYVGTEPASEDADPIRILPGDNYRITVALKELVEQDNGEQTIIWARFTKDILLIEEFLRVTGRSAVTYYGGLSQARRQENKVTYQNNKAQYIIANQKAMGKSHTFTNTRHEIYYSNYFDYEWREQSEDRAHRIGQLNTVLITDIVAEGTVDGRIINALRAKKNVADVLQGDPRLDWI